MKHLLKFFESNQDDKITDRDLELIENCFLDYIDSPVFLRSPGEFTPQFNELRDYRHIRRYTNNAGGGKFPSGFVLLNFGIPESTHASVQQSIDHIRKTTNSEIGIGIVHTLKKYFIWKWIYGFINQISGDVMRCESYGFKCYFVLDLFRVEIIIKKKSAKKEEVSIPDLESVLSEILETMKSIEARFIAR